MRLHRFGRGEYRSPHAVREKESTRVIHEQFVKFGGHRHPLATEAVRWSLWLDWQRGVFDDKCKHWVNQSTLPKDALLENEVVLPPLSEQRRIVAKLEKK